MTSSLRLLPIAVFVSTLAAQTVRLPIEPFGEVRSELLLVNAGDTVRVFPERGAAAVPEIDSFIYDGRKVLLAKDDEEAVSPNFEWRPLGNMRVYVLARNAGPNAGTVVIEIIKAPAAVSRARAPVAGNALMQVYYATDRARVNGGDEPFGPEPSPDGHIEYGLCRVSIPRDHRMGELEGPAIWKLEFKPDPNKHIVTVGEPVAASQSDYFAELKKKITGSKEKQALVFIHGFDNTFSGAARRTAQIAYDLGFDGVPIFYSWPSHGILTLAGYKADERNAALSVAHFKSFLIDLSEKTGAKTIHLIAHSMGNRVLIQALNEMALARGAVHFHQVILMAPDIDSALFSQLAGQMKTQADNVTLYASSRDLALKASEVWAGYNRAGQGGDRIVVIPGIVTIDASAADTSSLGLLHQYYADSRSVMSDVYQLMQGNPPSKRFGLRSSTKNGYEFWRFVP